MPTRSPRKTAHAAPPASPAPASRVAAALLAWYDAERRELPWRYAPGVTADPYRVWLSEIMLQQTVVKAAIPYFDTFTKRWPSVRQLAAAPLDDVMAAWAGLGYYARARNLHACARAVAERHDGRFPASEAELRALPGIGPYTAAAVAAIGFGIRATPVDGNVERVVARLFAVATPLPKAKPELRGLAETLTPAQRAGDFAQAMMDLGATVCTPRAPQCDRCPLRDHCAARIGDIAASLPQRTAKPRRPVRHGIAYVVRRADGMILLRRRPARGLLGGMLEIPTSGWGDQLPAMETAAPVAARWQAAAAPVEHVFTHFQLQLAVYAAAVGPKVSLLAAADAARCCWVAEVDLERAALPSVMRKALSAGLSVARASRPAKGAVKRRSK